MNIGIGLKRTAYTPEAYAYKRYLSSKGFKVQLEYEEELDLNNDINIYIMGLRPFWKNYQGKAFEIHEYQSLSTAPLGIVKDLMKKSINKIPKGRIFLNEIVHSGVNFQDKIPYIYRDMGVDRELFQNQRNNTIYDIVYSGSIVGRIGLIEEILRLAKIGFNILVIGEVHKLILEQFIVYKNVNFIGRVERNELPELYAQCKAGLNFTPNIYPFNVQTSTKTLEYLASGLTLISNKYQWIDIFSKRENIEYINTEKLLELNDLRIINYKNDFKKFEWNNVLEKSNLYEFIKEIKN
ncbi:glycosyltransferase family 4 protein [Aliarcobacter thereius]|uniref:Glycosyltransferase family 4 protein n=1 Tax=Aliarcobacter thereius TaxID=544718 RepID=A0A5R9GYJ2_9BACT|nr:glycosyltransferase family 4 protein [Aliarcobacter thereius]TLS71844.1 glycosyltransferase family 4 protein [Aliarcobacter thereius]